ncbi:constitutive coactivator of peroxisome proliferator-activated receptor gamma [Anabrus simplex]|uniref:constitutive coactivator of peroxisome proliferator-activated receptor gamma n=1 Tax=Anabrus simplex TaxID=316456 RepID=UPI0035A3810E
MGLISLEKFLLLNRNRSKFCHDVDLKILAKKYQDETNKKPVFVVDGSNFIHYYYDIQESQEGSRQKDFLLGGQLRHFVEITKDFVNRFESIGISVIFYFDGPTDDTRREFRKIRNELKLNSISKIFCGLEQKRKSSNKRNIMPLLLSATGKFVPKYECNCKVLISQQSKAEDLAEYARINKHFAILSNDTDFIALPGEFHHFTISHLDLDSMIAVKYNKFELAKALSLNVENLVWFGAILSRDEIPNDIHLKIIADVCKEQIVPPPKELITSIAKLVHDICQVCHIENCQGCGILNSPENVLQKLTELWKDISDSATLRKWLQFGVERFKPKNTDFWDKISALETCLGTRRDILWHAYIKHINCDSHPDVLNTLLGRPFEIGVFLENTRNLNQPSSQVIFQKIRQNTYSILLHESDVKEIEEWGSWNGKPLLTNFVPVKTFPKADHPGLLALWEEDSEEVKEQRWELIAKSISTNLKTDGLKKLDPTYLVPALVLHFLINEYPGMLEEWEAEALIILAITLNSYSLQQLDELICPVDLPRVVNLATLYGCGISTVLFLLAAVGYPLKKTMPWYYFDGPLFYYLYKRADKGIKEDLKPKEMKDYRFIRNLIFP